LRGSLASGDAQFLPLFQLWASFDDDSEARKLPFPSRSEIMATYSENDFQQIAAAVGKKMSDVAARQKDFENIALAFRLDRGLRSPDEPPPLRPTTPHQMRAQMEQISRSACRLLNTLGVPRDSDGVPKIEDAYDGPGDFEILKVLSWAIDHDEDPVVMATRRIARLAELVEAIEAASDLERWARYATDDVTKFGQLTVPKCHQGDVAVNNWIAAMLSIYGQITGKGPGTSVGAPASENRGVPGGPLIRFLKAAGKPLGIEYPPHAWRSRIRGVLDDHQN